MTPASCFFNTITNYNRISNVHLLCCIIVNFSIKQQTNSATRYDKIPHMEDICYLVFIAILPWPIYGNLWHDNLLNGRYILQMRPVKYCFCHVLFSQPLFANDGNETYKINSAGNLWKFPTSVELQIFFHEKAFLPSNEPFFTF